MQQGNRLLFEEASAWYLRNLATVESWGVECALRPPTTGLNNDSVLLEFVAPARLIAVTIWDSGEFEVITHMVAEGGPTTVDLGDLADETRVAGLLDRVVAQLT
jgi:hypothetical protein